MRYVVIITLMGALLSACHEEEATTICCFEPAGTAHYYINNQTSSEITFSFVTSEELGSQLIDSLPSIASRISVKILEDGIIGVNPQPSNSLKSLSIVRTDNGLGYQIPRIDDDSWEITSRDFEAGEYGLTNYQLTINDSDF
ncbi:hypothetical protein [Reichenbachiella sp. MSK19-1]|uniref:hypothetical protein n=1 Tax=Reichenbachiella sp. MSK19-1 TaxID=1897631 RepID=UPI0011C3C0FD|nr:hypothetical protein [Reichenbachiella sp. MSK19-1]